MLPYRLNINFKYDEHNLCKMMIVCIFLTSHHNVKNMHLDLDLDIGVALKQNKQLQVYKFLHLFVTHF